MKVVGLTGGIGSGKSTVAKMFEEYGISIYLADDEAKKLMHTNTAVKEKIIKLFGAEAYLDGILNRAYIANIVFNDSSKLKDLNSIVHPAVANHFEEWKNKQQSAYVIKEAAILFENGGHKQCDYTILVSAPSAIRIQRVIDRDNMTEKQVLSRMNNQWEDSKKIPLSDFVVYNIDLEETKSQVADIHHKISS
ncbi:dephospho-CoA kinase [Aquimarina algicola]|uniref:Dephospho-CoA kinase n=1 Tax=Aquimarina algicola TaxID=2589995 RepID=A0A504IUF1_9FLAO|nr:dephospho-CoA kinase [Aquimarina algicola]TPN82117.1 dephospho-CoA kinase [Aquimarina algicola]